MFVLSMLTRRVLLASSAALAAALAAAPVRAQGALAVRVGYVPVIGASALGQAASGT